MGPITHYIAAAFFSRIATRLTNSTRVMQVPELVEAQEIETEVLAIPGVLGIHDLHVWALTSQAVVGSLHVTVAHGTDIRPLLDEVKQTLHLQGVHSSAVQVELIDQVEPGNMYCQDPICSEDISLNRLCCDHHQESS